MALLSLPCNFFPWRGLSPWREDGGDGWDGRPTATCTLAPSLLLHLLHLIPQGRKGRYFAGMVSTVQHTQGHPVPDVRASAQISGRAACTL